MLKRKAFNRIFLSTIVFLLVFGLYNITMDDMKYEEKNEKLNNDTVLYTLNDDNYISKSSVYVAKELSLEERIKEKLEIMIKNNNKNALLPSYFNPILPEGTEIKDVKIEDSIVKVYFSKELINITETQSEKMVEAIVYTITEEKVLGIEIYVDGNILKYIPHTKKELPTVLTRDFGINKTYEVFNNHDINKATMIYYLKVGDNYYETPVTKYFNDKRELIEIIFNDLNNTNNSNLINLLDDINLIDYKIEGVNAIININKEISNEEYDIISKNIFNNYDLKKIDFYINNKKAQKTIEK